MNASCRPLSNQSIMLPTTSLFLVLCFALGLASAEGAPGSNGGANRLSWEQVDVPVALTVGDSTAMAAATYRSSAIWLDPGRVVLTPPNETPIPMPPAPYVLRGLRIEVVDPAGSPVPLTEVYNHHIALYDGIRSADLCGGAALQGRDALWSVGAESRHTPTFLPDGYGIPYGNGSQWSANIHVIRTEGVAHVKHCIECHCREPVAEAGGGSEDCCPDGSLCGGVSLEQRHQEKTLSKPYHIQYTVWFDNDPEAASTGALSMLRHEEVRYHTLDASGCQLEWQVPGLCAWRFRHAGTAAGSGQIPGATGLRGSGRYFPFDFLLDEEPQQQCISVMRWSTTWSYGGRVVFGKAHVHIGAIDIALYREPSSKNDERELICLNEARYGTGWSNSSNSSGSSINDVRELWDQPPGNELGYVVEVSRCRGLLEGEPVVLEEGDVLTVEARYRAAPGFEGVMGLLDIAVVPNSSSSSKGNDSGGSGNDEALSSSSSSHLSSSRMPRKQGHPRALRPGTRKAGAKAVN